jgi:trans-aconitate 2-methyltransferase
MSASSDPVELYGSTHHTVSKREHCSRFEPTDRVLSLAGVSGHSLPGVVELYGSTHHTVSKREHCSRVEPTDRVLSLAGVSDHPPAGVSGHPPAGGQNVAVTTVPRDTWNPSQYERFHDERRQPFVDLLGLCRPVPGGTVVDLGCGPGALTAELHAASQAARTCGIDSSPAMIDAAVAAHGEMAGLTFAVGDIEEWTDEHVDLVFANASFHWVDDHLNLLARMRTSLGPGGQLAFQVPANFRHPSHVLARSVALETPFLEALDGDLPPDRGMAVLAPETYADLLYELGATRQVVRMEVYGHLLDSTAELVEWVQGTLLTAYRSRLDEGTFEAFVERYRERLIEELGDSEPYFYAFRRILCWAAFE